MAAPFPAAATLEHVIVVGAALVRSGRLLVAQRAYPADLAGRWELPGGKVEPGEDERAALVRECLEELGVTVIPGRRIGRDLDTGRGGVLRVYAATLANPGVDPVAHEHAALRWADADEVLAFAWLPSNRPLVPQLTALLAASQE